MCAPPGAILQIKLLQMGYQGKYMLVNHDLTATLTQSQSDDFKGRLHANFCAI